MRRILCLIALSVVGLPLAAQDGIYFVPQDRIAVRVMRDVPSVDLAPGVHVRTVVGTTGSFSYADFDATSATVPHHHTREQVDVGITGVFEMVLGNHTEFLTPGAGVIIPPNVTHAIANKGSGSMTLIEFHTVPRPDLVPPRPTMTFPANPQPTELAGERKLMEQLDGAASQAAGTAKTVLGETCTMIWRTLKQGAVPTDIHPAPTRAELFVYIVRGQAAFVSSGQEHRAGPGALVVIPAMQQGVRAHAIGTTDVALVEFTTERR